MNTPLISLLHATKGRPKKAAAAMAMWHDRMALPAKAEYIFAVEDDDPSSVELLKLIRSRPFKFDVKITTGLFGGSAPAWDKAYRASEGKILIQVSDDVEPPDNFDHLLLGRIPDGDLAKPLVIAVSDGFRKDKLLTTFICTRAYAEMQGEFIHAGYPSVFSDDEASYRAWCADRDGAATLVDARDLVFLHRHAYHDKSVPMDETYAWQNRNEAYAEGYRLFRTRNPDAYATKKEWRGNE